MIIFFNFLMIIFPVLISVAFCTLMERKVLGLVGMRPGPNKVSFGGFLQPIVDAFKLSGKQVNMISSASLFFYYVSSFGVLLCSLFLWMLSILNPSPVSFKFNVILLMMIFSLNSLLSIFCGWSTFSKYSLIGSMRKVSQLISYEAVLYLCLFVLVFFFFNFSTSYFFEGANLLIFLILPLLLLFWVPSCLAELSRSPFDFPEGESELVSGFNTEFGSSCFTLLFLAEYSSIVFICLLTGVLFFFSASLFFFFFFIFSIVWIRCVLPRFRFDKLMMLCWKLYIPILSIFFMVLICSSH